MPSLQNMSCRSPVQRSPLFGGRASTVASQKTNLSKVGDLVPKPDMFGGPSNMGPKRLPPPKLPKINEKINGGDNAIKCQEPIVTEVP